jgi:hypothetical protein
LGILCESSGYNVHFANVYLEAINFVSIRFGLLIPVLSNLNSLFTCVSVALYGLLLFYGLTKDELVGRRPLAKFLCIKLIVMATFYQSFVVHFLPLWDVLLLR